MGLLVNIKLAKTHSSDIYLHTKAKSVLYEPVKVNVSFSKEIKRCLQSFSENSFLSTPPPKP